MKTSFFKIACIAGLLFLGTACGPGGADHDKDRDYDDGNAENYDNGQYGEMDRSDTSSTYNNGSGTGSETMDEGGQTP